jgi:tRNA nucleotidyltransferase/poly(A) polymerase
MINSKKYISNYNNFLVEKRSSLEIPLPKDIIQISDAYIKAGKEIFLVGGAVRDFIKGIPPKDYDLVTNALPEESKKILKDFNVSDEQGKNFGVLRVYTKDDPEGYEVATYRRDISKGRDTKGDDQKVEIGSDVTIEDDCMRRDLTINSLFYDIQNKKIVDLVGGIDDIKNGIIRAVGDANQRFIEDRLRICRIFRFAARTGGEIEEETSNAIKRDNRLKGVGPKDDVSQERIWEEFEKAFKQSKDFKRYLEFYNEYNMWGEAFPGSIINNKMIDSNYIVSHLANIFKNENLETLENKMVQSWKIPIDVSRKVKFLISLMDFNSDSVMDFYKAKSRCHISNDEILDWIRVAKLNDKYLTKFIDFVPKVSAKELMDLGFKAKALGDEINRLESEEFKK